MKKRFDILKGNNKHSPGRQVHITEVIDILFEKGLDEAMNYFKPNDS
jgi:hypothetical protein